MLSHIGLDRDAAMTSRLPSNHRKKTPVARVATGAFEPK
jgi:hypothetical protein